METNKYSPTAIAPAMFKSYYVVWKLGKWEKKLAVVTSLNRTMQYGNC